MPDLSRTRYDNAHCPLALGMQNAACEAHVQLPKAPAGAVCSLSRQTGQRTPISAVLRLSTLAACRPQVPAGRTMRPARPAWGSHC